MVKNRVLLALLLIALAAAPSLGFLELAANRLVSGAPVGLPAALAASGRGVLVPAALLALGPFLPQRRLTQAVIALAAAAFLLLWVHLAGAEAARLAASA
ncbi:MAG TPA: ABC transporter permease, partial [Stellaceae bacterium]|nr:ABC transporter permease [Stellaceae bacterium]